MKPSTKSRPPLRLLTFTPRPPAAIYSKLQRLERVEARAVFCVEMLVDKMLERYEAKTWGAR